MINSKNYILIRIIWNACEFIKFEACEGITGTTGTNGTSGSTISEVNDEEESSLELKPVDTKIIYIFD